MQQGVKFTEVWNIVQVKYIFWLDASSSCEAQIKLIEMVQTPPSLWEKADPPFFANISKTNHPSPPPTSSYKRGGGGGWRGFHPTIM